MSLSSRYFVRVGTEVRGPYDVAQLRQLAEVGVIARETESTIAADGPWTALETRTEGAEIFPPRVVLALKPTTFAVENDRAVPLANVPAFVAAAQTSGRLLRSRDEVNHPPAPEPGPAAPPNDVELMVREVGEREAQFAPPPPPPPKRRMQRRQKLVALIAVLGNGTLLAIPTVYHAWGDDWAMIVIRGWFVIFNGGLVFAYFALPKE